MYIHTYTLADTHTSAWANDISTDASSSSLAALHHRSTTSPLYSSGWSERGPSWMGSMSGVCRALAVPAGETAGWTRFSAGDAAWTDPGAADRGPQVLSESGGSGSGSGRGGSCAGSVLSIGVMMCSVNWEPARRVWDTTVQLNDHTLPWPHPSRPRRLVTVSETPFTPHPLSWSPIEFAGRRIYKGQLMSAIQRFPMIPDLTEPDITPTEVRSLLPAAFGSINPTATAFIFARN